MRSHPVTTLLFLGSIALADSPEPPAPEPPKPPPPRARLAAAAQRNENVAIYRIDNNATKEANIRLGANPTAIAEPLAESSWFAAEHGRPPSEVLTQRPATAAAWHSELWDFHQNSVFNARTFFQVGEVQPSHRNLFGVRASGPLPKLGALTASLNQSKIRGMVNGNVLVPLANERTPLTTDPELRPIVERFLNAYPDQLPNRLDFDPRALNTNSPQNIDSLASTLRLDTRSLILAHTMDRQRIRMFQFVAGQNPDTDIHTHRARAGWRRAVSAGTLIEAAASFHRVRSVLVPEPAAVGPRVRMGFQIEELGPDSQFPINRAANSYRYGAALSHRRGAHQILTGSDITRFQLNGIEANNARGQFQFTNNWGRSAIENLRFGAPTSYEGTVGELSRGYRNWTVNAYVADRWRVHSRLQLYLGLRYSAETAPEEVQRHEVIPYSCDCNNLSPLVSLAWQMPRAWLFRAMYTTTFSAIPPVTYQQIRNSLPTVSYIQIQEPYLADPLHGLDLSKPHRVSPTVLSPDLVSPYSHQYNATFERALAAGSRLRLSYLGSRTFKLMNAFITNRADPVPGIPLTTATVDQRRADRRYFEVRGVANGGIAYYDAAQVAWDLPVKRGVSAGLSYTFSKAIDDGVDFSAIAANRDMATARSQSQYESFKDRKGLSNFDATHNFLTYYTWDVPSRHGNLRGLLGGWQVSGTNLWKSGTPMTLYVGSDAPNFGNVDGSASDRPNIADPTILGRTMDHPNTAPLILRRDRFGYITPGEPRGNLGRNTFRKATIWNWNAAVSRPFPIHNDWTLTFRAEAYNLSNTPQFDEPQRNLSSPAFGKITNTLNDGRVFQLLLRLNL